MHLQNTDHGKAYTISWMVNKLNNQSALEPVKNLRPQLHAASVAERGEYCSHIYSVLHSSGREAVAELGQKHVSRCAQRSRCTAAARRPTWCPSSQTRSHRPPRRLRAPPDAPRRTRADPPAPRRCPSLWSSRASPPPRRWRRPAPPPGDHANVSGGTRSPIGLATKLALDSLFGTWRGQGHHPFHACRQLLVQSHI
jgi:hypothetical protein